MPPDAWAMTPIFFGSRMLAWPTPPSMSAVKSVLRSPVRSTSTWPAPRWRSRRVRGMSRKSKLDRKSTRLNSSHITISYAVFCLKEKKDHHHAVHREKLVVGFRLDEVPLRRRKLQTKHCCEGSADEEEHRNRGQVDQADALVISG